MQIEQKGVPPYTVWTAENPIEYGGKSQPGRFSTFIEVIAELIDITERGEEAYNPEIDLTPIRVVDSQEQVVLSMDNPDDVNLLKLIVQSGKAYEEIQVVKKA